MQRFGLRRSLLKPHSFTLSLISEEICDSITEHILLLALPATAVRSSSIRIALGVEGIHCSSLSRVTVFCASPSGLSLITGRHQCRCLGLCCDSYQRADVTRSLSPVRGADAWFGPVTSWVGDAIFVLDVCGPVRS